MEVNNLERNIIIEEKKDNWKYGSLEIDLKIVDKIIFSIIVDDRSNMNTMFESTMNKLKLKTNQKAVMKMKLAN